MRKVYGYARLSRDEDKKNYGSIETQRNIIYEYAREIGVEVEKIFEDDDISGYIPIEDRPAFYELYNTVKESKEKPMVLMKDWSRLSRNNGVAQMLLNEWKAEGVELILIKEMGAPFNILKDNDDIVGITTWVNERYVKETSRKVRDALADRMKKGIVIQGPRYGYIKGAGGKLTVNEEVREAVQTIFELYDKQDLGFTAICNKLNKEYDFKNPAIVEAERFKRENKQHRDIRRSVREYWESDMVEKILKDETYLGTLVTHKKEVQGIHGKKVKVFSKEETYRFPNHHEAIITQEQFDRVQEKIKNRRSTSGWYKKKKYDYIFSGFVRCGECGYGATGICDKGHLYYGCTLHAKYRSNRCSCTKVREDYVLENFKEFLKNLKEEYKDILKKMNLEEIRSKAKTNQERLKMKLDKIKQEYKVMQSQKIKEMVKAKNEEEKNIIEETYNELISKKMNEISDIGGTLKKLNNQSSKTKRDNLKKAIDYFDEIIKSDHPSKQVLSQVLEHILFYKDKSLKFELKMSIDKLI